MSKSADSPTGLSARMAATAARITTVSRRLTAARGLAGFTIDELCDEVGIARRTFFNYFPGKEDAVLGIDETERGERLAARFLERGSRGWGAVFDDVIDIAGEHAAEMGLGLAEHADFHAALEREPRLLVRFMGLNRARDEVLASLIARREDVPEDDPRPRACVELISIAMSTTMSSLFAGGVDASRSAGDVVADTLRSTIDGFRAVLATDPPSSPPPSPR
ncbi:TetR/AcrR family transcriptional regulator, partial [Mycetocola reblochoni]